jgi:hypothetical protein
VSGYLGGPASWAQFIHIGTWGVVLLAVTTPLAFTGSRASPRVSTSIAILAFAAAVLACATFLGATWPIYVHPVRPVYELLVLATVLYLFVATGSQVAAMRGVLVLLIWSSLLVAAWDQLSFWGGLGQHVFLDIAFLGAIVLPPWLGWAGRSRRR